MSTNQIICQSKSALFLQLLYTMYFTVFVFTFTFMVNVMGRIFSSALRTVACMDQRT